jgi:hypothetical protein
MIRKSTIIAVALVATGVASPAFAQIPPAYYYDYVGPYAYSDQQPYGPYGYAGYWPPNSAAGINYNIHTPPNH